MIRIPIFVLLSAAISLCAEETISNDSLARMSFYDLINVKVTVASRHEQSIYDAPSMVTTYSHDDIEQLGYYTLGDLAKITPGYSVTYSFGEQGFETRGGSPDAFNNNRHVVLVDGISVNHARANKAPTQEELPLLFADKVEFLRGPSSTLYGNGAVYGVVNVVPLIPESKGTIFKNRLSIGTAQNNRQISSMVAHRDEKVTYSVAASYFLKEASKAYVGQSENENHRYWDDRRAIFMQSQFELQKGPLKGFGIGTSYLSRSSGLGEHWTGTYSHELNNIDWITFVGYLKYRRRLTDQLTLNSALSYNRSVEEGTYTRERLKDSTDTTDALMNFYKVPIKNAVFQTDIHWDNPIVAVDFGFNLDWRQQIGTNAGAYGYVIGISSPNCVKEQPLFEDSDDYYTGSIYGQLHKEIPLFEGLLLTAGLRGDFGKAGASSYDKASPRVAIIQNFRSNLSLKLLWATAFAAPMLKEVELNNESRRNNPSIAIDIPELDPENFNNYEVGLLFTPTFSIGKSDFSLNIEASGFYNESSNQIKLAMLYSPDEHDSINYYRNTHQYIHSSGFESQIKLVSSFGVSIFSNYSFTYAYNSHREPIADIPRHRYRAGVLGESKKIGLYGSLIGRYISSYSTSLNNKNYPGSTFLDGTIGWKSPWSIGLEFQVLNIFDAAYYAPLHGVKNTPLPLRTFNFTVTAQF